MPRSSASGGLTQQLQPAEEEETGEKEIQTISPFHHYGEWEISPQQASGANPVPG